VDEVNTMPNVFTIRHGEQSSLKTPAVMQICIPCWTRREIWEFWQVVSECQCHGAIFMDDGKTHFKK
jgi:hypothetical protein